MPFPPRRLVESVPGLEDGDSRATAMDHPGATGRFGLRAAKKRFRAHSLHHEDRSWNCQTTNFDRRCLFSSGGPVFRALGVSGETA